MSMWCTNNYPLISWSYDFIHHIFSLSSHIKRNSAEEIYWCLLWITDIRLVSLILDLILQSHINTITVLLLPIIPIFGMQHIVYKQTVDKKFSGSIFHLHIVHIIVLHILKILLSHCLHIPLKSSPPFKQPSACDQHMPQLQHVATLGL